MLKEKEFTVEFDAFPYAVRVVITNDVNRSRQKRSHIIGRKFDDFKGDALCSVVDNRGLSYVFLPFRCPFPITTHECVHAIYNLYDWVGIQEDDSEVFAYLLEHLLNNICKRFR
jgi:hypothetical protein